MFRKILFFFAIITICLGDDGGIVHPQINGYADAEEGECVDDNGNIPNYLEVWFKEHPANCTEICDQLPTCSGVTYSPSRFKLKCYIYVFQSISTASWDAQDAAEENPYLEEVTLFIPPKIRGDSTHASGVDGNGGLYCYLRETESPSVSPSSFPSTSPSTGPTFLPSLSPSTQPSKGPSFSPSHLPSVGPSHVPTTSPSCSPSNLPSTSPTSDSPSSSPTRCPTSTLPSNSPSVDPSTSPSFRPSQSPTSDSPSTSPTKNPTFEEPSLSPTSEQPSNSPTNMPSSDQPSVAPTKNPTFEEPTTSPSKNPTSDSPSSSPTSDQPTVGPTLSPSTDQPSTAPTKNPTFEEPTTSPSKTPTTDQPSNAPTSDSPSTSPTCSPSNRPSVQPTFAPSTSPSTSNPSVSPTTSEPSVQPSFQPSDSPETSEPSTSPTVIPSHFPSTTPSRNPTGPPSLFPSGGPSVTPSSNPTGPPSTFPSSNPSFKPSVDPTKAPSFEEPTSSPSKPPTSDQPSVSPSEVPSNPPSSEEPSCSPTKFPTSDEPTQAPSVDPTQSPSTDQPTRNPSKAPSSEQPTTGPTVDPSVSPTLSPSHYPSLSPTTAPSFDPSTSPSCSPSVDPTVNPTSIPSSSPTSDSPSVAPTTTPSSSPTSDSPSCNPSVDPTQRPTQEEPSVSPSLDPTTDQPSSRPTLSPSLSPTSDAPSRNPSGSPSNSPTTEEPSLNPSSTPSNNPTVVPSDFPSVDPTAMPSYGPSVMPTNAPSDNPTVIPSNLPSNVPSVTSPCSIGKVNVLGSHFIYIDEDESFVDEEDLVCLAVGIPARYTLEKIWPSDAETETGYYIIGGTNEFWTIGEDTKQECTQKITGCFPWSRIRTQELMGLTTVTDPAYYEEVEDGVYFHNVMTFELSEEYDAPDGWAKPEDTSVPGTKSQLNEGATIERKVIYEIPWLILLQTEITLSVNFSVVIPTPGPSTAPTVFPSGSPSVDPTLSPSVVPSLSPTSEQPSTSPSVDPSVSPTVIPTHDPSVSPSVDPSANPSHNPSLSPSYDPSVNPTTSPSVSPSVVPTSRPSGSPTPREYFYFNLTLRADDVWLIGDYLTQYPTFSPSQRFEVIDDVQHGGFTFLGSAAQNTDIVPDELGNFKWTGANVTSDVFQTWMAESDNIRVRFDILLFSPRDCVASFTDWGTCSTTCGEGVETRTWVVTDPKDAAGSCEHWDGFVDTRSCYIEDCPLIDEIVTRFAVYNPDLDEASTVCMNFTTITNLPWKTVETGFSVDDPNDILNEDSVGFSYRPVDGCWPSWSYEVFDGICGEDVGNGFIEYPTGMFIQLTSADDPICRDVCDYFDECIGHDFWPSLPGQSMICEVLGPQLTQEHAREANEFVSDGRKFNWYEDNGQTITGGYLFAEYGAKCYKKSDPVYSGTCLQDFNMCFTMDFVCNLDDVFYLELTAENLLTGTQVSQQFETRIATDASCAQIIGDVSLSGSLEAFHSEDRLQSVIQFYKGNTIFFTMTVESYANVDSIALVEMRYTQDDTEDAETVEYPSSHVSAITTDASQVVPVTQTFTTKGRFSMLVTDPITGSVDGVYTKWVGTFEVNFVDGRRRLVEGTYRRNIRAEINTLIYPPKCANPEADAGETLTQTCDEGQRILWCDENGQWTMLVDSCGDDIPVNFAGATETPSVTRVIENEEEDSFLWRTSAIAIAVSLCCACCVYYLLVCRKKKEKDTITFFDGPGKTTNGAYIEEVAEDSESSELGTEFQTPIGADFVTKRTPMGDLPPPPHDHANIEYDSDSNELGPYLNTGYGKDINSDIDQDMKAANQVFNDLGLHDLQQNRPATPV